MIRYLVNSLHSSENSYRSALRPSDGTSSRARQEFLGSNSLEKPVSQEDIADLAASLNEKLDQIASSVIKASRSAAEIHPFANWTPNASHGASSMLPPAASTLVSGDDMVHTASQAQSSSIVPQTSQKLPVSGPCPSTAPTPPVAGVYIPLLPSGAEAWKVGIAQWEHGYDKCIPLCDWPSEWYTGHMKPFFASKRSQRKLVALEYNR